MPKTLTIRDKIKKFNKQIQVSGDKSLSIRWVLLASQAIGKSKGYNLLMSEDVLAAIDSIKKQIGSLMFQFEYLNKQKMSSVDDFINRLELFRTKIPDDIPISIETRNPNYLNENYFQSLKEGADYDLRLNSRISF